MYCLGPKVHLVRNDLNSLKKKDRKKKKKEEEEVEEKKQYTKITKKARKL